MSYAQTNLNLIVQLESRAALENIDEILSVPGIDMVATGRADLSQELGVPGQKEHPDVIEAENFIIRRALEHHKVPVYYSQHSRANPCAETNGGALLCHRQR